MINFAAMKNTMAALWRPGKGVCINDLSLTLFLFQSFHEIDVRRVLDSGPWAFNQHILIVHRLCADEQPQNVLLFHTTFGSKFIICLLVSNLNGSCIVLATILVRL